MNKKETLTEAISIFKDSNKVSNDYLDLFVALNSTMRQGSGLMWSDVIESIDNGLETQSSEPKELKSDLKDRLTNKLEKLENRIKQLEKNIREYKHDNDLENAMKNDIKHRQLVMILENFSELINN